MGERSQGEGRREGGGEKREEEKRETNESMKI